MKHALVIFLFAMACLSPLGAADKEVILPEVVGKGLNALKLSGSASALDAWLIIAHREGRHQPQ